MAVVNPKYLEETKDAKKAKDLEQKSTLKQTARITSLHVDEYQQNILQKEDIISKKQVLLLLLNKKKDNSIKTKE